MKLLFLTLYLFFSLKSYAIILVFGHVSISSIYNEYYILSPVTNACCLFIKEKCSDKAEAFSTFMGKTATKPKMN